MSKIGFSGNPSNGASHTWRSRRRFNYSSSKGGWQAKGAKPPTPTAPTLNASTDLQDMNDATGLAAKMRGMAIMYNSYSDLPTEAYTGTFVYVRDENCLYMWTGDNPVPPAVLWYGDRAVGTGSGGNVASSGAYTDIFQFVLTTQSNATDFGNLLSTNEGGGQTALSNATKALFGGGPRTSSATTDIEQITISTAGNTTDFGDLVAVNSVMDGIHSGAYGFFSGGNDVSQGIYIDTVQTVVVDTPGNASSFGTLQTAVAQNGNVTDNSRVVRGGGQGASDYQIQYWSNASMTTAQDFGDWAGGNGIAGSAVGAGDRGIFMGRTYSDYTYMEYISIQNPGNALSFGNLLTNQLNNNGYGEYFSGSANNATTGTKFGGITNGGSDEIQYITMDTLGDGQDFGDLTRRCSYTCGTSGNAS